MSRLTIIVAATKSNGIGQNSSLPWRLPKEMKYFTQVTSTAPEGQINGVIMGRNTWESIPKKHRPLASRINIVTSRNENYKLDPSEGAPTYLHNDLTTALARLSRPSSDKESVHRVFIIGGSSLYTECLALSESSSPTFVDRILLTRIISPDFSQCDAFMPDFLAEKTKGGEQQWARAPHDALKKWVGGEVPEGIQEENGVKYEFQMWIRGP